MRDAMEITLSLVLGLVFLTSAIPKLRNPRRFMVAVLAYEVLPAGPSLGLARLLPPGELLLALLLLSGTVPRLADALAALFLFVFAIAVGVNVIRGRVIDCGCFGNGGTTGARLLAQDAVLLLIAAWSAEIYGSWDNIAPWSPFEVVHATAAEATLLCVIACIAIGLPLQAFSRKRWRVPHIHGKREPAEV